MATKIASVENGVRQLTLVGDQLPERTVRFEDPQVLFLVYYLETIENDEAKFFEAVGLNVYDIRILGQNIESKRGEYDHACYSLKCEIMSFLNLIDCRFGLFSEHEVELLDYHHSYSFYAPRGIFYGCLLDMCKFILEFLKSQRNHFPKDIQEWFDKALLKYPNEFYWWKKILDEILLESLKSSGESPCKMKEIKKVAKQRTKSASKTLIRTAITPFSQENIFLKPCTKYEQLIGIFQICLQISQTEPSLSEEGKQALELKNRYISALEEINAQANQAHCAGVVRNKFVYRLSGNENYKPLEKYQPMKSGRGRKKSK